MRKRLRRGVLVAALKDHDRAKVVGMPSFGKGSIQYPLRLVTLDDIDPMTGKKININKTGTVRVTIAKLIAPTSGPISGTGIAPHFLEADPDPATGTRSGEGRRVDRSADGARTATDAAERTTRN